MFCCFLDVPTFPAAMPPPLRCSSPVCPPPPSLLLPCLRRPSPNPARLLTGLPARVFWWCWLMCWGRRLIRSTATSRSKDSRQQGTRAQTTGPFTGEPHARPHARYQQPTAGGSRRWQHAQISPTLSPHPTPPCPLNPPPPCLSGGRWSRSASWST